MDTNIELVIDSKKSIFTYIKNQEDIGFTEESIPNFTGSGYSTVKGYTDQVLRNFKNTLQLRIRMPISHLVSGRNLIDKLAAYKNICSIPNSMTVLDDMWSIIDKMIEGRIRKYYEEVVLLADRALVMSRGEVVSELTGNSVEANSLISAAS